MATLCHLGSIRVFMHADDHPPPHFHAFYQGSKAKYRISPPARIAGRMPNQEEATLLDWAWRRQAELMAAWDVVQQHGNPGLIDP